MSGYYAFKAYYYKLLMSEVTMYLNHKWHTRKQKPQINGGVLNVLHILGQDFFLLLNLEKGYSRLQ